MRLNLGIHLKFGVYKHILQLIISGANREQVFCAISISTAALITVAAVVEVAYDVLVLCWFHHRVIGFDLIGNTTGVKLSKRGIH